MIPAVLYALLYASLAVSGVAASPLHILARDTTDSTVATQTSLVTAATSDSTSAVESTSEAGSASAVESASAAGAASAAESSASMSVWAATTDSPASSTGSAAGSAASSGGSATFLAAISGGSATNSAMGSATASALKPSSSSSSSTSCSVMAATDNFPPIAARMGTTIEGASVDPYGNLYVVNQTHFVKLGMENKTDNYSLTRREFDFPNSGVIFKNFSSEDFFVGSRYSAYAGSNQGAFIIADAGRHTVYIKRRRDDVLVELPLTSSNNILQPNDIAIGGPNNTVLYFSGMNYTADSIPGLSGDIAYYNMKTTKYGRLRDSKDKVLETGEVYRINGIETSVDSKTLYFTNAKNSNSSVVSTVINSMKIGDDGVPIGKPEVLVDLQKAMSDAGHSDIVAEKRMDPDGMRITTDGILYVTLNGTPFIAKIDTTKTPATSEVISLASVKAPSNLEFAGPSGNTLYIIGQCEDKKSSCIDKLECVGIGKSFYQIHDSSATNATPTTASNSAKTVALQASTTTASQASTTTASQASTTTASQASTTTASQATTTAASNASSTSAAATAQ